MGGKLPLTHGRRRLSKPSCGAEWFGVAVPLTRSKGVAVKKLVSLLAISGLFASPAVASVREAAFASSADQSSAQTSLFIGATYRVGLHRRTSDSKGRIAFKLSGMALAPDGSRLRIGNGLEIAGGRTSKPSFFLAGREIDTSRQKSNLSSGAAIGIGIGVVLIAGAVFLATYCDNDCDNAKNE